MFKRNPVKNKLSRSGNGCFYILVWGVVFFFFVVVIV